MATPTLVTITGKLRESPTTPDASATVTFKCTQYLRHIDGTVIEPFKLVGVAQADGTISMQVPATDDPDWSPQGWTYRVSIDPANGTPVVPFDAAIPVSAAGTGLTLGAVIPVGSPSAGAIYAPINHTHPGLGDAVTESDLATALMAYVTTAALNAAGYATGDDVEAALADYVSVADLAGLNYIDASELATALSSYATNVAVTNAINSALSTLDATYATDAQVTTAISNALATLDATYATDAQLTAAINALGLGNSATRNVGTTAGTVAAGDDSRITGAAQKSANLSDLANPGTARTNLGVPPTSRSIASGTGLTGGGDLSADRTLSVQYGTTSGTAAQGNDSRITGAAQKAQNLADLADAGTARTNLGLGGAAVLAVGTGAGEVAAGDDARIVGAAQKAANLSDLSDLLIARANLGALAPDIQIFNTSGTWNKPANARLVHAHLVSGGGGGGSGRRGAAGTVRCGGGGGGGGGVTAATIPASSLPSSVNVFVGSGGPGGPAVTTNDTNGNNGTNGGVSSFTTNLRAGTGANTRGSGGTNSSGVQGSSGQGNLSGAGASAGAASTTGGVGSNGNSLYTGGGGAGGGITSADVPSNGGFGGGSPVVVSIGILGGVVGGAGPMNGVNQPVDSGLAGTGAGGGAASITGPAQAGGTGGLYGSGGGGGGASLNGFDSGAGGDGANGIVIVITFF